MHFLSLIILLIHLIWLECVIIAAWTFPQVGQVGVTLQLQCLASQLLWLLLDARASVVVPCGLSNCNFQALECCFSSSGPRAWLLCDVGSSRPGIKPVSPALAGGKSQLFCQSRNEDIMMDRKIFYKLLYYLRPSECTGNSMIYSIGCIRYLFPFQELLNQEHRGIKQATGYFKV